MKTILIAAFVFLTVFATGRGLRFAATESTVAIENDAVREINSPARTGSSEPSLSAGRDGSVYLSWLEPTQPSGYTLMFAVRSKDGNWSTPRPITQAENRFESSILALPDGSLAAYWLTKSGPERHANDINISISRDGGQTWGKPIVAYRDRTPADRGFVSIVPVNGGVGVVWLNGSKLSGDSAAMKHDSAENAGTQVSRHTGDHKHPPGDQTAHKHGSDMSGMEVSMEKSLTFTSVALDGTLGKEVLLDSRVCECCTTSAAPTPDGLTVVYRDRSEQEVRDISIVRLKNAQWSKPEPLSKDGWKINGCPVNGPAISSSGKNVAVAWYTAARDQPRVYAALSADGGNTFGPPILVGDGNPIGRVDTIALASGNALVSWAERTAAGTEVRTRIVRSDQSKAPAIVVAKTASGIPHMTMAGDEVVIAWTESGDLSKVRTAILSMARE